MSDNHNKKASLNSVSDKTTTYLLGNAGAPITAHLSWQLTCLKGMTSVSLDVISVPVDVHFTSVFREFSRAMVSRLVGLPTRCCISTAGVAGNFDVVVEPLGVILPFDDTGGNGSLDPDRLFGLLSPVAEDC